MAHVKKPVSRGGCDRHREAEVCVTLLEAAEVDWHAYKEDYYGTYAVMNDYHIVMCSYGPSPPQRSAIMKKKIILASQ